MFTGGRNAQFQYGWETRNGTVENILKAFVFVHFPTIQQRARLDCPAIVELLFLVLGRTTKKSSLI